MTLEIHAIRCDREHLFFLHGYADIILLCVQQG